MELYISLVTQAVKLVLLLVRQLIRNAKLAYQIIIQLLIMQPIVIILLLIHITLMGLFTKNAIQLV
jgi:hypothetical protein